MDHEPGGKQLSEPAPATEPLGDPRLLSPHRIASRALVSGLIAGAAGTVWALSVLAIGDRGFRAADFPLAALFCLAGMGVILAFLVVVEQLALRLPLPARPPFLLLCGAGGGLLVSAAVLWVEAFSDGRGAAGAWEALGDIWSWVRRNPERSLVISVDPLVVFLVAGTLRTLHRPIHPLLQVPAVAVAGFLALLLHSILWRPPGESERVLVFAIFIGFPPACVLGLALAERLEKRLAGAIERWREGE